MLRQLFHRQHMRKQLLDYSFMSGNFKSNFTAKGTDKALLIVTLLLILDIFSTSDCYFFKFFQAIIATAHQV